MGERDSWRVTLLGLDRWGTLSCFFTTAATELNTDPDPENGGRVVSVSVSVLNDNGGSTQTHTINTKCVIVAAGGFEASPRLRAKHLGPGWDGAYVRGTPHNIGDMLEAGVRDAAAKPAGDWSGCHCVAWDANAAPKSGDRGVTNEYTKSGYPLGIMVNSNGKRFVDEGPGYAELYVRGRQDARFYPRRGAERVPGVGW